MKTISISALKTHLSAELKKVRSGESLVVMDRKTPVALIEPWRDEHGFRIIPPRGAPDLGPTGILADADPLITLLDDREHR
jgi:antitoxin (DNA-binding transcriptional repressor) of toxin-antitoxin stability system